MDQKRDVERFRQLQDSLMRSDNDFKVKLKGMSENLNTSVYDKLSEIVLEWSNKNNIDLVIGKMEVIFNKSEFESTAEIIQEIKDKGLFFNPNVDNIDEYKL